MCVYIFAGRFQPFHNGHMQVFQQLCEKLTPLDTLVLGVISPFESEDIKDEDFLEASKEHHLPERNPWDVLIPLSAVSQIARTSHYARQIVPTLLPRPEYGWKTLMSWFPRKRVWIIPSAGEDFDNKKSDFFINNGDRVIRLPDTTGVSGRELRELYQKGQYEEFAANIPDGLADIYFRDRIDHGAENDFQKRAKVFESHSKWVTDEKINCVPENFFRNRYIGDLLDAGGGTGYLSWYLYQSLKECIKSVSLIDISRNMLDEAELKRNYPVKTYNLSIETFCRATTHRFQTILMRQVLHYVEDVDTVIKLLRDILSNDGIIYVGQLVVEDQECKGWHDELMRDISMNRKRTFVYHDFIDCFTRNGFKVAEVTLTDYEENFADLFERRTYDMINYENLKLKMETLTTESIKKKMAVRFDNNSLYFSVKFCHLFLEKNEKDM